MHSTRNVHASTVGNGARDLSIAALRKPRRTLPALVARAPAAKGDGVVDTVLGLTDTGTGLLDGLLCDIVQAGMPADLFIETGERTFFDYLMRPLLDSFLRAFREH